MITIAEHAGMDQLILPGNPMPGSSRSLMGLDQIQVSKETQKKVLKIATSVAMLGGAAASIGSVGQTKSTVGKVGLTVLGLALLTLGVNTLVLSVAEPEV